MATGATLDVVTEASLGAKGLVVTVKLNGDILGHLMVGKAKIVWFEPNAKKKGRIIPWKDFKEWVMTKPVGLATRP